MTTTHEMPPVGPERDALVARATQSLWSYPSTADTSSMAALYDWCELHPYDGWNLSWFPEVNLYNCSFYMHAPSIEGEAETLADAITQAIVRAWWAEQEGGE